MAVVLNGVLATDSQMLNRLRERDEYLSVGKKLFVSPDKRAVIAVVGSEWDSIELALVWTIIQARLTAFYLSYDAGNPLEFSDEERALLSGASSKGKVVRRFFLATRTHLWEVIHDNDDGARINALDPKGYHSHGSECNMANVFYKAGFNAPEIIRRIARLSNTCGGEPQVFVAKDLEEYPREVPAKPARKPRQPSARSTRK
jgi:hypothetical protein